MQRVLVEVVIEAPFGSLRVMTTYLEYYSVAQRAAQVERIRELVSHLSSCRARKTASACTSHAAKRSG